VKNIRSTLATVWRIAAPYFNSEDKWAGRGLLAAVIAIELALVGNDVLVNLWRARFYNALQDKNCTISRARCLCSACSARSRSYLVSISFT
jgi:putative ATP-binding cassette transporter